MEGNKDFKKKSLFFEFQDEYPNTCFRNTKQLLKSIIESWKAMSNFETEAHPVI